MNMHQNSHIKLTFPEDKYVVHATIAGATK